MKAGCSSIRWLMDGLLKRTSLSLSELVKSVSFAETGENPGV